MGVDPISAGVLALSSAVGTAANLAKKGPEPQAPRPSGGQIQIPNAPSLAPALPEIKPPAVGQSFIPAAPTMNVPQVGDYDRNLMQILAQLQGGGK